MKCAKYYHILLQPLCFYLFRSGYVYCDIERTLFYAKNSLLSSSNGTVSTGIRGRGDHQWLITVTAAVLEPGSAALKRGSLKLHPATPSYRRNIVTNIIN